MQGRERGEGQVFLVALAAALCIGAVVVIVKIAGEPRYGGATSARVLYIAIALALFGPNAYAGLRLAERRPRLAPLGFLVAAVSLLGFAVVAIHLLDSDDILGGGDWHLQGVVLALSLAGGQMAIVLSYDRDDDPPPLRLLTVGVAIVLLVLALLLADEASQHGEQVSAKTLGTFVTLYLLGAALLALFHSSGWLQRGGRVRTSLALDHVVIAVSDRARSASFYGILLGAEVVEQPGGRIAFRVGDQLLNVHEPGTEAAPLAQQPVRPGNSDLCFVWPGSPDLAVATIQELGAELVAGPVAREGAAGPGQSVYTRDPDGSLIELISYV
jgi:catechol 2,3-dioxygenase-like lactoylglutathione lyase family enzyme